MTDYGRFAAMLASEFQKYLIDHDDMAAQMPGNAQMVFQVEGEDEFNRWHQKVSGCNREPGQRTVSVRVGTFRSRSLIGDAAVAVV